MAFAMVDLLHYLSFVTVEPFLFLYMMATFLHVPVFQALVYTKTCLHEFHYNETLCDIVVNPNKYDRNDTQNLTNIVQTEASYWIMYFNVARTIPSIPVAIFMGSWTDTFGRKFALVLPCIGNILSTSVIIIITYYPEASIGYILIGTFLSGLCGEFATMLMAVFSYLSDITEIKSRTIRIAIVESMIGIGATIGSVSGGLILDASDFHVVFMIIAGVYVCCGLYAAVRIKEKEKETDTSGVNSMQKTGIKKMCNIEHPIDCLKTTFKKREYNHRSYIILLNLMMFMVMLILTGTSDFSFLFMKKTLGWSSTVYGYFMAAQAVVLFLGLLIILPICKIIFKLSDLTLVIISNLARMLSLTMLAFTMSDWMPFIAIVLMFPSSMSGPGIRSALSKLVSPDEQGKMYAFVASLEALAPVIATLVINNLYPKTLTFWAGFCFVLLAAVALFNALLAAWVGYQMKGEPTYKVMKEAENEPDADVIASIDFASASINEPGTEIRAIISDSVEINYSSFDESNA